MAFWQCELCAKKKRKEKQKARIQRDDLDMPKLLSIARGFWLVWCDMPCHKLLLNDILSFTSSSPCGTVWAGIPHSHERKTTAKASCIACNYCSALCILTKFCTKVNQVSKSKVIMQGLTEFHFQFNLFIRNTRNFFGKVWRIWKESGMVN